MLKSPSYEEEYYKTVYGNILSDPKHYERLSKLAFYRYFSSIPNLKDKKIVEYGCGLGKNIFMIRKIAIGYDSSNFSRRFCETKGIKYIRNFSEIKNKSMDIVLIAHTLEHVDNPLAVLKLIKNKLKENGKIIVAVPKEIFKLKITPNFNNYHLYAWNFETLTNLLHRAGFKAIFGKQFYGTMYHKLSFLAKINFKLYLFFTKWAAKLRLDDAEEFVLIGVPKQGGES
jgi:SAM-dependent methyltransferase